MQSKNADSVFHFFEQISAIPRASTNTSKIADYLVEFAKKRSLSFVRDEADNVIIKKRATRGYEERPTVIFQGHTDIVADKLPDVCFDFQNDGIKTYRDGDFIRAKGTTLGADDGIAIAYALAILDSDNIEHPNFEAVFTSDEEIGLIGANALDTSRLSGRIMINIDSDREGVFIAGCAGGVRLDAALPYTKTEQTENAFLLKITDLCGGHSGVEINRGHENAIKMLSELLLCVPNLRIGDIFGGAADNAIPNYAECIIDTDSPHYISDILVPSISKKYRNTEPDMKITLKKLSGSHNLYSREKTGKILKFINEMPTGVYKMSEDIDGLVETSSNLGIIDNQDGRVKLTLSIRSSNDGERQKLSDTMRNICKDYGASLISHGEYPAWEYKKDSPLRETLSRVYYNMYKTEPRIEVIHAGLECGVFTNKIEGLDCISLGPDIFDIHTTDERLSIPSATRVWEFLKTALKEI